MTEEKFRDFPFFGSHGPLCRRPGRTHSGQPRTMQFFDWGQANWLVEPQDLGANSLFVGQVTYYPNRGEPEHLHFGEEQVIYIISGRGFHIVNGHKSPLRQGETIYLQPHITHAITNDSDEDMSVLCIYGPSRRPAQLLPGEALSGQCDRAQQMDLASVIDVEITSRLLKRLSQALGLSLRLLDANGRCLIDCGGLPLLCRELERNEDHCQRHIQAAINNVTDFDSLCFCACCGQVSSLIIPIVSGNMILGYIKCGEFFITPEDQTGMAAYLEREFALSETEARRLIGSLNIEKINHMYSAAEATLAVAGYIVENGLAMARQKERDENRLSIINEQMNKATLEKALREADFKLLQSQINPHFLFNTLNIISQMAYMDGADRVADLVCSLAELMRATLRKANMLIPLGEEIALLKDYLHIQKARFEERLKTVIEVEEGLEHVRIPILLLQPLVENAIVHGVEMKVDDCRVEVLVKRVGGGRISLSVRDNGPGFEETDEKRQEGLGLRSIKARLQHFYNDQFTYRVESRPGLGAFIELTIPLKLDDDDPETTGS